MEKTKNNKNGNLKIRVATVDDYKLFRVGLVCALGEYDFIEIVKEFSNAHDLFQYLDEKGEKDCGIDVCLMDLGLPEINGISATMKLKEKYEKIKVIVLTSHLDKNDVIKAFSAGANGYCVKTIEPDVLSEVIKNVKDGACYIDSGVLQGVMSYFLRPEVKKMINEVREGEEFAHGQRKEGKKHFFCDDTDEKYINSIKTPNVVKSKEQKLFELTERELDVLRLMIEGKSNAEIAEILIISMHTAKAHVCNILQKLCVENRVQAAVIAVRDGLV